jgi:16S rRNA (cytosine1402-N4)-methyltransferase
MTDFRHKPVLLEEVLELLQPNSGGRYLDGTLGGGGHAGAILEASAPDGTLVGFDRDGRACQRVAVELQRFGDRLKVINDDFRTVRSHIKEERFDGILLDLGVSSFHFDDPQAGFSFSKEGPLDMRMDQRQEVTAETLVNESPEAELEAIIRKFGEERFARRIARAIADRRRDARIETTFELAEIVSAAIPRKYHPRHHHAATRTFQALRIAVNKELDGLDRGLEDLADLLVVGGVLAVISFHSLEDRIVKWTLRSLAGQGRREAEPVDILPGGGPDPDFELVNRKPILASEAEQGENPRSRSAMLRAVRRTGD